MERGELKKSTIDIKGATFDELDQIRLDARAAADFETLQKVIDVARARDSWDDTDPSFGYLVSQCSEDLKDFMTYYG